MQEYGKADGRQACVMLRQFLEERYKGTRPCCGAMPCAKPNLPTDLRGAVRPGEWTAPPGGRAPFPLDASTANPTKERSHEI
jgi:glycerol-3-phosphate dehydrogenase